MILTDIWIYEGRNSAAQAFWNYKDARAEQDEDNGCTPEQAKADGFDVGGSEAEGFFYIDDGGSITKVTIQGEKELNITLKMLDEPLPPVEFSVGNLVRTTLDWADRLNNGKQLHGRICDISEVGPGLNVKRRVKVQFDHKVFWNLTWLWFSPDELELDTV